MRELGIRHFLSETRDKLGGMRMVAASLGIELDEVCYVGDDKLDVPAMRAAGFAASVADAHPIARQTAHWVADKGGGRGAVRQLADLILDAHNGEEASFGVIIPARYGSTRLPGKPLIDIAGKPMILRVVDNAMRAGASFVIVATDDERVSSVVEAAGHDVVMTSAEHASGTDRLAEVARVRGLDRDAIVVNVQGDEPLLDPTLVREVANVLAERPAVGIATAATPIRDAAELMDPNVVKVTTDRDDLAIAFSRAPIPWVRGVFPFQGEDECLPEGPPFLRHIGLYAYRVGSLLAVADQEPVAMERAESLEQLRAQWLGIRLHVTVVDTAPGHGVDTEADLDRVRAIFESRAAVSLEGQRS